MQIISFASFDAHALPKLAKLKLLSAIFHQSFFHQMIALQKL